MNTLVLIVRFIFGHIEVSLIVVGIILLVLVIRTDIKVYLRALPYYLHQQYPFPEHYNYISKGRIVGYINHNSIKYKPECDNRLYSKVLNQQRNVFVYLPPRYTENSEAYPLIIALHGNGKNHLAAANILPPLIDDAIIRGDMPPTIMVAPDFSLGKTIREYSGISYDGNIGSFYINSNRGRFEDYFIQELIPWIQQEFNVSHFPSKVSLLGQSMGGFGAFSLGLRYPNISSVLIGISPAVDVRYSCNGDSMADFDPSSYSPLTQENPKRRVMSIFGGLISQSEEKVLYPVFKVDNSPSNVWPNNLSLWECIRKYNPTDILRDRRYDNISETAMYLVAGDQDEYNINSKVLSFIFEAKKQGFNIYPEQPIKKNGHHTTDFVVKQLPDILRWLGKLWGNR